MTIKNACMVCGSLNIRFFSKKETYDFFICPQCQLIFVHPLPSTQMLVSDFYSEKSGYHANIHTDPSVASHSKKTIAVFNTLDAVALKGNLLDMGCSNGEFLLLAKKRGFNAFGVEVNPHTAAIAVKNGLDVFCGTLQEAGFKDEFFSVIHLGDVIEHVTQPDDLINECKRILKKGGVMVISTPNADCFWANAQKLIGRRLGVPWSILIPPYHLYLFSDANLSQFLKAADFSVLETSFYHISLHHELAATGLWQAWKRKKSVRAGLLLIGVFSLYVLVYAASFPLKVISKKDFEMLMFAKKI